MPDRAALVAETAAWFEVHARDLPWRRPGTTPWGVVLSEVLSQQTQIARVVPKWHEFLERWPTPAAMAASTDAEVLRAWDRLGYPRRALALRRCAIAIVERHGGRVPSDRDALRALPGIGAYTSAAIAAFGFGVPEPVVDTNVRRVLARAVHGRAIAVAPNERRDEAEMRALLPRDSKLAVRFDAAAMELGALVCTSRAPQCSVCPIARRCAWLAAGSPNDATPPRRSAPAYRGSDRQLRGEVLRRLRDHASLGRDELVEALVRLIGEGATGNAATRAERILTALVAEGFVAEHADGMLALAGEHPAQASPPASPSASRGRV